MHLAPWLLLLAPSSGPDELLPATPDGWRYERLELPLDFAPEIELAGFEELRFAPGMFAPDSDSYFSYALAIRIDARLRVDEEILEGFFQKYYAGLCRSVAHSRGLELDLDSIRTSVEFDGRDFLVSIAMFDAFVTRRSSSGSPRHCRARPRSGASSRPSAPAGVKRARRRPS
jgi:hypothetical protein